MLQHYEKMLVQKALDGSDPAWNFSRFDEKADVVAVREACEVLPVFSQRRIVRVENCPAFYRAESSRIWADLVKNLPDTCLLLFIQQDKPDGRLALSKAIGPSGQIVFDTLSERELQMLIGESVKKRDLAFQKEALRQLVFQVGTDAATLAQETHKLEAYVYPRRDITKEDVRAAAIQNEQADAFDITDLLIDGNYQCAFDRLALYMRQGGVVSKMRGALAFSLRQLLAARLLMEDNVAQATIMKKIRGPWLARQRTCALARQVSPSWIQYALCAMAEGDEWHKSGEMDEQSAFELSVMRAFIRNKKA